MVLHHNKTLVRIGKSASFLRTIRVLFCPSLMDVINLSNHIVRKAFNLSLTEMAVLCDIIKLSNNPRFDHWCIKSKDKMAEWLDVSRDTIFRALKTLELKGLIERGPEGKTRPTQFIHDIESAQEEIGIYIKNKDAVLISKKFEELKTQSQNQTGGSSKIRLPQSQNQTQVYNINKQFKATLQTPQKSDDFKGGSFPTSNPFVSLESTKQYYLQVAKEFPEIDYTEIDICLLKAVRKLVVMVSKKVPEVRNHKPSFISAWIQNYITNNDPLERIVGYSDEELLKKKNKKLEELYTLAKPL